VRYAFIRDHRLAFRVELMCRVLGVSRSGYYAWRVRPESARARMNRLLLSRIRMVHRQSRCNYGSPRVTDELRSQGERCGQNRVARVMRRYGIRSKAVRKFRATTDSNHNHPVAPNLLARRFTVERPDTVWVSDITYIWTQEGWLYLAGVLDLCSRRIVGCAMSSRVDGQLTLEALSQALGRRRPKAGLLHHSDRGKQYAALEYQRLLHDHGLVPSMSRKGDCWDNAPMESFFATLKRELVYRQRFATRQEAQNAVFEYIEVFYNRKRRHSSLGSQSPAEFERLNYLK